MNEGWVKLHRKILDSEVWQDHTAMHVFMFLLLSCDRRNGTYRSGRFKDSQQLKLKPTTYYAALKRLEQKYEMVDLMTGKVTIKYTDVVIKNWHKYQVNDSVDDNPMTIQRQSNDNPMTLNKKERSKEVRIKKKNTKYSDPEWLKNASEEELQSVADIKNVDIRDVQSYMEKAWNWYEIKPNDKTRKGRNWRATVMGWIQRDLDSGKIQRKIAYVEPEVEQISDEERAKNLEKIAEAKKRLFKSG